MAMLTGKAGGIVWGAELGADDVDIQYITSWAVDAQSDVVDVTTMRETDNWKAFLQSFKGWTATAECLLDSVNLLNIDFEDYVGAAKTPGLGTHVDEDTNNCSIEFWFTTVAGGGILYGKAVCNGISVTCSAAEAIKITYSFQGIGELTYTTTEPSVGGGQYPQA